jgi:hypothetical protein
MNTNPVTELELNVTATALRVTAEDVEANIKNEYFFTAYEGAIAAGVEPDHEIAAAMKLLTICVLELQNGFTVLGQSACASPENYNRDIGQRLARTDAVNKIWAFMGYELRTYLSLQQASAPAKGGEADRQAEGHDAVGTGDAEAELTRTLEDLPSQFGVEQL